MDFVDCSACFTDLSTSPETEILAISALLLIPIECSVATSVALKVTALICGLERIELFKHAVKKVQSSMTLFTSLFETFVLPLEIARSLALVRMIDFITPLSDLLSSEPMELLSIVCLMRGKTSGSYLNPSFFRTFSDDSRVKFTKTTLSGQLIRIFLL